LSAKILLLGGLRFVTPVNDILKANGYRTKTLTDYFGEKDLNLAEFDTIVTLEHERDTLLIGKGNAVIDLEKIPDDAFLIHICGNVSVENARFKHVPEKPRQFGYMSFTTDYVDNNAVIDLHTAGLKVAEGMLAANSMGLARPSYKAFMETNYPALSFDDERFW
jgi:hypothetical protein